MEEFPEIKEDYEFIAEEREKMRLFKAKQKEIHGDDDMNLKIIRVL